MINCSHHKELPFLSIIIPTRNRKDDLRECLFSIAQLDYPKDRIEIIIEDNGSTDSTQEMVGEIFHELNYEKWLNLRIIHNDQNLGAYGARADALGFLDWRSNTVMLIDDDVILKRNIVKQLISVFENGETVGVVGARSVYNSNPNVTAHGAGFVNWWLGVFKDVDSKRSIECDYVITCCCIAKKDVLNNIGGFDLDYFTSHGDVDICAKAKKAGFKVIYEPAAVVVHKIPLMGTRTIERLYYLYRNKILLIRKNANFMQKITSLSLYALFLLPKALLDSIICNRKIDLKEMRVLFKAVIHGFLNRKGKIFEAL